MVISPWVVALANMQSNARAVISSFLVFADNEQLPSPFLGPLVQHFNCDPTSAAPPPTLYRLGPHSCSEFKGGHASVEHDVVGIAYSITTNRTSVYFWFHSTVRLDVAKQSLLALLQHVRESHVQTVIRLPGVDKSYCESIHDSMSAAHWNRENGYELHVLDVAVPVKATALGASWNVDGETFEMDSANSSDAASILSLASVGYDPAYILELLKHPIFSQLMRVVRLTSTKRAVSWSLVHSDFSIGLLGTVPEYRRKGLVGLALSSTVEAYRAKGMTNDNAWFGVQPHCFVHWSNTASQQKKVNLQLTVK